MHFTPRAGKKLDLGGRRNKKKKKKNGREERGGEEREREEGKGGPEEIVKCERRERERDGMKKDEIGN